MAGDDDNSIRIGLWRWNNEEMIGFEVKIVDSLHSKLTITPTRVTLKVSTALSPDGMMELRRIAEKCGEHIQPLVRNTLRGTFFNGNMITLGCNDRGHPTFRYADGEVILNTKEDLTKVRT